MPGTEPYIKPCNNCSKQIILGIDPTTNKWRPWDNYATKEKHNCKQVTDTSSGGSQQSVTVDLALQEQLTRVENKLDKIEQMLSMQTWMFEKVAKKIGVDDLIENQNG